jgi:hypothetical protein
MALKKWDFYDEGRIRYQVSVRNDGQDCDGRIDHGVDEFEMTHGELATRIGLATIRHGQAHTVEVCEGEFNTHVTMVFGSNHDEGWSRTTISWQEI